MKRIRLIVAYDGSGYSGWQIQENAVTVEGELSRALRELLGEEIELAGASRTDAGVHALGNVAVFDTETRIPPEKIAVAVNHHLPEDIRVQISEEVPPGFHPRFCDSVKTYEYRILNTPRPIPTYRRYTYHVYRDLDMEAMKRAAAQLVGTHDYSAFCSAGSQVRSKVRTIYEVSVEEESLPPGVDGRELRIRVRGNGFLYNMVRIIAGTLVEAGLGRKTERDVAAALETGERTMAGPTAPALGLTLIRIEYV